MSNENKNSILIVDDEKSNIEVLIHILGGEYSVRMTKSGSSAIDHASNYPPDLILLDILMPDMDGYDVLALLKASEKTKNIPVIFITGLDSDKDEEKGLALGAVDFIRKPFDAGNVRSKVKKQMQIVNQTRQPDGSFFEGVREMEEINTIIGLEWASGDMDIFHNTLKILQKNLINECDKLTSFLDKKDMENFMINVHAIKTSLAMAGARKLSETAFQLESASRNMDIDFCQKEFPVFREKLLSMHEKLTGILERA